MVVEKKSQKPSNWQAFWVNWKKSSLLIGGFRVGENKRVAHASLPLPPPPPPTFCVCSWSSHSDLISLGSTVTIGVCKQPTFLT